MLSKFKNALLSAVGSASTPPSPQHLEPGTKDHRPPPKFRYSRPLFLNLTPEEGQLLSADRSIRPITIPRGTCRLPWRTGYAETINAGKSSTNEDQAAFHVLSLKKIITHVDRKSSQKEAEQAEKAQEKAPSIPVTIKIPDPALPAVYFGLFDGHAGPGAAVAAAHTLHNLIHDKLYNILELILPSKKNVFINGDIELPNHSNSFLTSMYCSEEISTDSLIIGALEAAFWEMDIMIAQDRLRFTMPGGCTALVAVFILGKIYLANAGDSRAILVRNEHVIPMSSDFTPETEKQRIRTLALHQPNLLGYDYTSKEYIRKPCRDDIGRRMLYRDAFMTGWSLKTITPEDLKFPVIYGEGKRSRVLATIGVTRGFGDHDLKAQDGSVNIKPFLSPQPEVRVFDLCDADVTENDVLIMGTDGLWDITTNEKAAEIVRNELKKFPMDEEYRYTSAAQELVMNSRGRLVKKTWLTTENTSATVDDISVYVIPLLQYKNEYLSWLSKFETFAEKLEKEKSADTNVPTPSTSTPLPEKVETEIEPGSVKDG